MTTLKEMKAEALTQVSDAIDGMVIRAKQNGNVHVSSLEIKIVAAYPLNPQSDADDALVNVIRTLTIKP